MMRPQCSHVKQFGICLICIKLTAGYFGYLKRSSARHVALLGIDVSCG